MKRPPFRLQIALLSLADAGQISLVLVEVDLSDLLAWPKCKKMSNCWPLT